MYILYSKEIEKFVDLQRGSRTENDEKCYYFQYRSYPLHIRHYIGTGLSQPGQQHAYRAILI